MYGLLCREFWSSLSMGKCGYLSLTRFLSLSLSFSFSWKLSECFDHHCPVVSCCGLWMCSCRVGQGLLYLMYHLNDSIDIEQLLIMNFDKVPCAKWMSTLKISYWLMSCDLCVTIMWHHMTPRLATAWLREITDSSISSWSLSRWCRSMSWGATWQWSSSVS